MPSYKAIKISGMTQLYTTDGKYYLQLAEMELLPTGGGTDQLSGGTPYAFGESTTYPLVNVFDGSISTFWFNADSASALTTPTNAWIAYVNPTLMSFGTLRIYPRTATPALGFRNFSVYGSNDTTNGANGTWELITSGLNMSGSVQWDEFVFPDNVSGAVGVRVPMPVLLSTFPATLTRGFRV